jgi:hypothetical protein
VHSTNSHTSCILQKVTHQLARARSVSVMPKNKPRNNRSHLCVHASTGAVVQSASAIFREQTIRGESLNEELVCAIDYLGKWFHPNQSQFVLDSKISQLNLFLWFLFAVVSQSRSEAMSSLRASLSYRQGDSGSQLSEGDGAGAGGAESRS